MEYDYPITTPSGRVVNPPFGSCWRYSKERLAELIDDNRIWFGANGNNSPRTKRFLSEVKQGITPITVWLYEDVGHTQSATQGLNRIGINFNNPKPESLIQHAIRIATGPDDIVLDSFAGSGTTAHAVLALNREDGGNRKFILVECEDYADSITAERVRRVIRGVPTARDAALREGLGGEFTYCELGDEVSIEGMLEGELPSYADIAGMAIHNATGLAPRDVPSEFDGELGFVYESENTRYHLLYRADAEWLRGEAGALNSEKAYRISEAAKEVGKTAVVFAPARYLSQRDLTDMSITFCQLPYDLTAPRLKSLQP
jgi:adenine-specific DNA-methyltransferase